jgi:hypothetical protein
MTPLPRALLDDGRVRLLLPLYWPELNPTELLNNRVKEGDP